MFANSPCASNFGDPRDINFCAPLKQLFDEHPSLLEKMDEFNKMVISFENGDTKTNWGEAITLLHEKLTVFVAELEPHSDREEDILFEMMVKHIGREGGPIAVMEYEHDTAKKNLKEFFTKVVKITQDHELVTKEKAFELFNHAKIVYTTLTDHFMKEEQILFPMAEKMLSNEEKKELAEKFRQMA
ncbi:hemerythrin domain-containing protein [Evansella cellulosilytica]|uniref:Hemerythrin HHE cation binding domain protein n=1 Tax=Evansella cellulosilytica (strain ATCC 21833 / DSM 2522 / FERM P-1141 / JCM 9156 / N-4) TaxID=649639 RepID=E6TW82_EVAC2|nr:hemerythrin domain-containing protein [Evansella cellulosilytica]ADU31038.1 Hemerythrin HHE cation binding domain protein [Evansella cellulosilytica DSM 2522]